MNPCRFSLFLPFFSGEADSLEPCARMGKVDEMNAGGSKFWLEQFPRFAGQRLEPQSPMELFINTEPCDGGVEYGKVFGLFTKRGTQSPEFGIHFIFSADSGYRGQVSGAFLRSGAG
ncbi:hypothetical protein L873DRAFT_1819608 [Choiromyces venosus 120613-1]|uniref:Uncharacterized protein n=1 Tax=Choiromyces venosus 120613-1 TaxID=1336337 RepID=A0A3N4IZ20_9PEZI|nr:hypothetical protein L873DRAFT_1819608 [Choiromyces venosus 120613-1]